MTKPARRPDRGAHENVKYTKYSQPGAICNAAGSNWGGFFLPAMASGKPLIP